MKLKIILIIFLILILSLFFIRLLNPREIDDVSPEISCENEKKYLEKSEILWIIPKHNQIPISENKEWCTKISNLNKTLGLHGIKHTYHEFKDEQILVEELEEGIKIFKDCFGFNPEMFKPPNLELSKENKKLINEKNLKIRYRFNQLTHKVYHCDDSGTLPNWFHDIF